LEYYRCYVLNALPLILFKAKKMGCESSQMTDDIQPFPVEGNNGAAVTKLINSSKSVGDPNFQMVDKIADGLFKEKKIVEAISIYQKIIEEGYSVDFDIAGVGNAELAISRYEWFVYRWYDEQRKANKIRGNAFDALSLCYFMIRNSNEEEAERGILWYEDMLGIQESVELLIGYANILYNRSRYDEAIKVYIKIIEKKPTLINAYVSLALTY
jgi:pentatricopeptide repeat protein